MCLSIVMAEPQSQQRLDPQEMLREARELSARLASHNEVVTGLLLKGRAVEKREDAVEELHTILRAHNSVSFLGVTRTSVIQELQQEHRVLRALRQENDELNQAVQENGDAVQYIMKKFHQHSRKLSDLEKKDAFTPGVLEKVFSAVVEHQVDALQGALSVAQTYVAVEDENAQKRENIIGSINKENVGLRSALNLTSNLLPARVGKSSSTSLLAATASG